MSGPCPACGAELTSAFCGACGEKRFDHHSLSLAHFAEHAVEAVVHFDGAILRTLRALVIRPGKLTAEWARGCRKPYLAPVQLFLLMNLLYFAVTAWNGWNTFNTNLTVHMTWTNHSTLATRMVNERLAGRGIDLATYRRVFDAKSGVQAKSLVVLMVPVFAIAVWLMRIRSGRYASEHMVFSLHFYSFVLLNASVVTSLATLVLRLMASRGERPTLVDIDSALSLFALASLGAYLILALRATGDRWPWAVLKGAALVWAFGQIVAGYRLVLFLVGFYTT